MLIKIAITILNFWQKFNKFALEYSWIIMSLFLTKRGSFGKGKKSSQKQIKFENGAIDHKSHSKRPT